jgi:hypothetical protein
MATDNFSKDTSLDRLRMMRWVPQYHGPCPNETVTGGVVDMWLLVDDEKGEGIISIAVPKGRSDIAGYVAACCGNPVRWVTDMVVKSEDAQEDETREIGDVLFKAYSEWLRKRHPNEQANGWTLNRAMSQMWFAFCGQLNHALRGRLLFEFMQLATTDYDPGPEPTPAKGGG